MQALALLLTAAPGVVPGRNLIADPNFEGAPGAFTVAGAAKLDYVSYTDEVTEKGVALDAFPGEAASGAAPSGSVSRVVLLPKGEGRWVTFRFRGRAEDEFRLKDEALAMKIEFRSGGGKKVQDAATRLIYREVLKDRRDFAVNGNTLKNGAAVWRTYEFEEYLPFAETDAVRVALSFSGGAGGRKGFSRFFANEFSVTLADRSHTGRQAPAGSAAAPAGDEKATPIGGRWSYRLAAGERLTFPLVVTARNADRLLYRSDGDRAIFAGNMTSTLQPGWIDENGETVREARPVADNLTIRFDANGTMTFRTKDLPNHSTARFPDTYGTQGYNPNPIGAQDLSITVPIDPVKKSALLWLPADKRNNGALPMGPVGIAVNGVVFFNPYDAGSMDASRIMDRCCGHPNQDYSYHYHKYPICVNTPFVDKGEAHSSVIGFAFDGFPLYGPYEAAETMAKDSTTHPLDPMNVHYDEARGWHYHVTPGRFPYLIGGYLGAVSFRPPHGPR